VQNIPQRNNAEERAHVDKISDTNCGNFLELLHLRCRDIPWLSFKLEQSLKKHTLWLSSYILNEIIDIAAGLVRQTLCENITNAEISSLIVDETTDVSNDEQLSICFWYVMQGEVQESFIGFYNPKNTEGKTLFILLKRVLQDLGLNINSMVGQCYDGAANMSGVQKGVAARMQGIVPEAVYVHCYAHRLHLALQDTLEANIVLRIALGVVQSLHHFFSLTKKESNFEELC